VAIKTALLKYATNETKYYIRKITQSSREQNTFSFGVSYAMDTINIWWG